MLILSLFAVTLSTASVYSENQKISISVADMQLRELFREIENNSEYAFFFNDQFAELEELQASPEERKRGSDMVYVNNHGFAGLRDFVAQAHQTALEILRAPSPKDSS